MQIKELEPIYTKTYTDFCGVDKVVIKDNGDKILLDCGKPIFTIKNGKGKMSIRHPSNWELTAIREFLEQNGVQAFKEKPKELRKRYA